MANFVQLVVLVVFFSFYTVLSNKITSNIVTETKSAGMDGKLSCTILSRSRSKVIWQKINGDTASPISMDEDITVRNPRLMSGKTKYEVLVTPAASKGWVFTLVVRALQSTDSGTYQCMLMIDGLDFDSYARQSGLLIVQSPPSIDETASTPRLDVTEGTDAILNCEASGVPAPKISWSRPNGKPLPGGQTTYYGNQILLKNIGDAVSGVYRCKADNNVRPPAVHDITVQVFHKPRVTPFRRAVGQAPDKNYEVELACIITGSPQPDMTWYKISGDARYAILDDNKHEVNTLLMPPGGSTNDGDFMMTLRIANLQMNDYGEYSCSANNIYGTSSQSVEVFYTPTCQGPLCSRSSVVGSADITQPLTALTITMAAVVISVLHV
ncbi:lachesin-like [Lineus longissimus]|uniref:lachesin-like n=1 Tax=Lineus longissimus TaxID=88925 RepID=UPI002B4DDCA7